MRDTRQKSGMVLLATVLLLTALMAIFAMAFVFAAGSRALGTRKQLFMERAFYAAEGGAETAAAYIMSGGVAPATLAGPLGGGTYSAVITVTNVVGSASKSYFIHSTGSVKGMARTVVIEGARQKTWAEFALWSYDNRQIYFKSGEKFYGRVHANNRLWFSGNPEFFARVTSADSDYGGSTNNCVFHEGFYLNAPTDSMADVDFGALKGKSALVVTAATEIVFQGTNMVITNSRRGWNRRTNAIPEHGVVYVATDGADAGTVKVRGRVDGRVTVVADRDIEIMNNLTYASDPATNSASDDALGLISGRDIVVKDEFPDNGSIYAHMMATGNATASTTDGSFGVENYWSRSPSGFLNVYGGIVQYYRGAVGTFSGATLYSGFDKKYTYDQRFAIDPPPEYPPLSNEFAWDKWREAH